jgi:glycerol transport system ATP-binding protein
VLVAQIPGVHPLPLGSPCTLHVDPAQVYGFDADGKLRFAPES